MALGFEGEEDAESWAAQEMLTANLGDERLNRRVGRILSRLAQHPEGSLPSAFQSWGETQAAYRFFSNEKATAERVLELGRPEVPATSSGPYRSRRGGDPHTLRINLGDR